MEQSKTTKTNQGTTQLFEFFTQKEAQKHLNQLWETYLHSSDANNKQDRQKKLFLIKQLQSIILSYNNVRHCEEA